MTLELRIWTCIETCSESHTFLSHILHTCRYWVALDHPLLRKYKESHTPACPTVNIPAYILCLSYMQNWAITHYIDAFISVLDLCLIIFCFPTPANQVHTQYGWILLPIPILRSFHIHPSLSHSKNSHIYFALGSLVYNQPFHSVPPSSEARTRLVSKLVNALTSHPKHS